MLKYSVSCAALAAVLVLSACSGGGGGIGSAGGSAPGTGTSPAPSPAPTPTPTPTPNTSLLALNSSETFTNDGATTAAAFNAAGTIATPTTAATPISVAYDAGARSYTVTSGSRSQTFGPADRDAASSTPQLSIYLRKAGTTTDSLTLTAAGTAGAFTYQYVGAGYWQRTVQGSDTVSGSIGAFTFGIRTQDSAMPRTGTGSYAIDVMGAQAGGTRQLASFAGSGTMDVDFAGGQLLFNASGQLVTVFPNLPANPAQLTFAGGAKLAAGTAAFNGQITVSNAADSGTLSGRFFGPAADEVGATFSIAPSTGGMTTVGSITGRKRAGNPAGAFTPFASYAGTDKLAAAFPITATVDNGLVTALGSYFSVPAPEAQRTLTIDPVAKTYAVDGRTFTAANAVAAESNGSVQTYRQDDGTRSATLRIYTPNGSNGSLALTYAGFVDYQTLEPAGGSARTAMRLWSLAGTETLASDMPRTGTASYAGQIYGTGYRTGFAEYDMRGTASWAVDFGKASVEGQLRPTFTPIGGGTALDLGPLSMVADITSGTNEIHGRAEANTAAGAIGSAALTVNGRFFGPGAQEAGLALSGTWSGFNSSNSADAMRIVGVAIGKRQ